MSMNLGNLNNFLQAYQQAQQQGQEQRLRQQQISAYQQQQKAAAAAGNSLVAPPQAAPPMAALAAMAQQGQGGAPAAAQGAPAPQDGPPPVPTGPVPQGASFAQAFGQPQGGAPQAAPQPQAQPQDPGLSGTAQSNGDGQPMDAFQESQQNIKAMAQSIKAANPGIDGATLLAAVHENIDMLKGVSPMTKATMQAQTSALMAGTKLQEAQMKFQAADRALEAKLKMAKDHDAVVQAYHEFDNDTKLAMANVAAASRERVAETGASSRIGAAQIGATSREAVGAGHDAASGYRADTAADASDYRADQGERGSEARGNMKGLPATAAPIRPLRTGGGAPKPASGDIAYLKANPGQAAAFDKRFGKGAAAAALK